jgi:serine/threonine-protein phosphatase 2A activator
LDDYQFLPYLIGAAQLSGHPRLRPKSVMDADVRSMFQHDYMYLAAVEHVHTLKVTSFAEHSPMLYDITAVKDWASVYRGILFVSFCLFDD